MAAGGLIEKTIDGERYEFAVMGASQGLKIGTRLIKIVGEPLAIAMGTLDSKGDKKDATPKSLLDREISPEVLAKAVRALIERLDEDEVLYLVKQLASENVMHAGKRIAFDTHYQGKFGHLFKVLSAALEVQFGNFLGEGLGGLSQARPAAAFQSIQAV